MCLSVLLPGETYLITPTRVTRITIAHPFHPHYGQHFELAQYRRSFGRECIDCFDKNGRMVSIQLEWTDAAGEQTSGCIWKRQARPPRRFAVPLQAFPS